MAEGGVKMAVKKVTRIYNPEEKEEEDKGLLRVAAYCRVSTGSNEQYTSYESLILLGRQLANAGVSGKLCAGGCGFRCPC